MRDSVDVDIPESTKHDSIMVSHSRKCGRREEVKL